MLVGGNLVASVACFTAESVKAYFAVLDAYYTLPARRSQLIHWTVLDSLQEQQQESEVCNVHSKILFVTNSNMNICLERHR